MCLKLKKSVLFTTTIFILLTAAVTVLAQRDTVRKKRLRAPAAVVSGFIGGESHDSYVIRARRGQTMTVKITWRREKEENNASFTVARGTNFYNAEQVNFGRQSNGGKTWTGKVPATGDYYIYVVAHPTARYTLRVSILKS